MHAECAMPLVDSESVPNRHETVRMTIDGEVVEEYRHVSDNVGIQIYCE